MLINNVSFSGGFRILPPPPQTNIPVQSGLVMQLDATNNLSYPGTGTTVTDLTGGFNHTLTDANMFVNSGGIKYFQFDEGGTTKKMNVIGSGPVLNAGGYTYMVWARMAGPGDSNKFLMNGTGGVPRFGTNSNGQHNVIDNFGNANNMTVFMTQIAQWLQITYTVSNANNIQLFVNNSMVRSQFSINSMLSNRHVGFGNFANWGRVAICCLYNRVLTAGEVTTNFNGLKGFFGL